MKSTTLEREWHFLWGTLNLYKQLGYLTLIIQMIFSSNHNKKDNRLLSPWFMYLFYLSPSTALSNAASLLSTGTIAP